MGKLSFPTDELIYFSRWFFNHQPDIFQDTLWLSNIAMENGPFIDGLPIDSMVIFHGKLFNKQRVCIWLLVSTIFYFPSRKLGILSFPTDELIYFSRWFFNHQPDIFQDTLWLSNIAMENGPFIDGLPIDSMVIFHGKLFNKQRVCIWLLVSNIFYFPSRKLGILSFPTDELIYFSRWFFNHQPDYY